MKTSSAKNKGRKLQQTVCAGLVAAAGGRLEPGDVQSCSMGANGKDCKLSPAAERLLGKLAIECKNRETLNVVGTFWDHARKYPGEVIVLVHKKNHSDPLVTITLADYLSLLSLRAQYAA